MQRTHPVSVYIRRLRVNRAQRLRVNNHAAAPFHSGHIGGKERREEERGLLKSLPVYASVRPARALRPLSGSGSSRVESASKHCDSYGTNCARYHIRKRRRDMRRMRFFCQQQLPVEIVQCGDGDQLPVFDPVSCLRGIARRARH